MSESCHLPVRRQARKSLTEPAVRFGSEEDEARDHSEDKTQASGELGSEQWEIAAAAVPLIFHGRVYGLLGRPIFSIPASM